MSGVSRLLAAGCCCLLLLLASAAAEYCMETQTRCLARTGCQLALGNYLLQCAPVVEERTPGCTRPCTHALVTLLLSVEQREGEAFLTCDCDNNAMCLRQRQHLQVCYDEVVATMAAVRAPGAVIGCDLARQVCAADTSCQAALTHYHDNCRKMVRGVKCTHRCNNSLAILYSRERAHKLRTCRCEGTEDFDCPAVKYHTETLCFRRQPVITDVMTRPTTTLIPSSETHPHRHHHGVRTTPHHTQQPTPPAMVPTRPLCEQTHRTSSGCVRTQGFGVLTLLVVLFCLL